MRSASPHITDTLRPIAAPRGSAVALGYFDGVHLGHRAVIGAAVAAARRAGLTPAVFTFELAEGNTLKGGRLLSRSEKYRRMAELGAREILAPPFAAFCALTPEDFVEQVLIGCFAAKAVFCGDNFTFGARAAGDVERLRALCAPHGIAVTVVEMAQYGGRTVSSTRIRAALEEGRLDDANAMLGAPYAIDWTVRHGRGIGTSRLGTPTINQIVDYLEDSGSSGQKKSLNDLIPELNESLGHRVIEVICGALLGVVVALLGQM